DGIRDRNVTGVQTCALPISKSGNTPEIKVLVPLIKNFENKLIAITGNIHSFLAEQADFVLNASIEKEACPNNLAPTTSTTAQLRSEERRVGKESRTQRCREQ